MHATVVVIVGGGAVVGAEGLSAWVGEDVIEGGGGRVGTLDEKGGVVVVDVMLRWGRDGRGRRGPLHLVWVGGRGRNNRALRRGSNMNRRSVVKSATGDGVEAWESRG